MKINLDDGYSFGLGFFETLHIYKNRPLFLKEHIERINNSIDKFSFNIKKLEESEVLKYLDKDKNLEIENGVLKIILSEKNRIFQKRDYTYTAEKRELGFKCNIANTIRNTNSIFTFHKTLNYADNIYEKRKSLKISYDEPIFLNQNGCVTEGATSNIFFVKDGEILTPSIQSGLLNGIVRQWIIQNFKVTEKEIHFTDIKNYNEVFLTNSLFGLMPVNILDEYKFEKKEIYEKLFQEYRYYIER